ncbi:hypothetical protein CW705_06080 [Candidatus Bathyarchaeota archaeon]|nr:MAG: hypothetical protein CW705_06080 [Candidatus Bathyarchaeota archaeon]
MNQSVIQNSCGIRNKAEETPRILLPHQLLPFSARRPRVFVMAHIKPRRMHPGGKKKGGVDDG